MKNYAIVGFGCAGYHAARAIRGADPHGRIAVFSDTGQPPFNPMLTTYYASQRLSLEGVFPFGTLEEVERELSLELHGDQPVLRVDARARRVETQAGGEDFDAILSATGARALVPESLRQGGGDFFLMRTLADAQGLRDHLDSHRVEKAVVVGGSMVGIKVAELLHRRGIQTTMADAAPYLFPLAAYRSTAEAIEARLREAGLKLVFNAQVSTIEPGGVRLVSGELLEADLVCLCIGTRANVELAANTQVVEGQGVRIGRGIVVDERMATDCPGVYAAGDCCEGIDLQTGKTAIIGLWANAANQGETAGRAMAGYPEPYGGSIVHNITHFMDMDFIGLGDNRLSGRCVVWGDLHKGPYLEAVVNEGRLQCVNILDCYPVSGVLKSLIIAQWSRPGSVLTPAQEAVLRRNGVSPEWIKEVGGRL